MLGVGVTLHFRRQIGGGEFPKGAHQGARYNSSEAEILPQSPSLRVACAIADSNLSLKQGISQIAEAAQYLDLKLGAQDFGRDLTAHGFIISQTLRFKKPLYALAKLLNGTDHGCMSYSG
jgi:hypothetical protein